MPTSMCALSSSRDTDIFTRRDIDRDRGAIVVIRPPDQYVANVLPVAAYARLAEFSRRLCSLSAELTPATSRSPSPRYGYWHSLEGGMPAPPQL